jgi:autotransporter-associated beta strand protein
MVATSGASPISLAIAGNNTITILGTPDSTPGSYTYDLFSYTGAALSATGSGASALTFANGTLSLGTTPSGPYTFALSNDFAGSQIDLTLTTYGFTWNGPASGAWDTTTSNWQSVSNSAVTPSSYTDGGSVLFADNNLNGTQVSNTGGLAIVNIQSNGVNPSTVAFTNAGATHGGVDYLIAGGSIGGSATTLNKSGIGTVTLQNTNTYGGGTFITGGTLATTFGGTIGPGPLALTAVTGMTSVANLGTSQSVGSITNNTAVGGITRLAVAQGATIISTGALSNTGTLNVNFAGQSGGAVVIQSAPVLNAGSSIQVNAGTLEFNLSSNNPATVQPEATLTVGSAAVLQLAGSVSALSSSSNAATVNNNGTVNVTGPSNQTVGLLTGTPSTDPAGDQIYSGTTIVGDGKNPATLTVAAILQSTLIINSNSTLVIAPTSGSSGEPPAVGGSGSSSAEWPSEAASSSSSGATAPSDPFVAIESALHSGNLGSDKLALDNLSAADGLNLSSRDDVVLALDYATTSGGGTLDAANLPYGTPALVRELAADGVAPSEIIALAGTDVSTMSSLTGTDFGPISSAVSIGSPASDISVGSSTAAVPEPSTLVLAALSAIALFLQRMNCRRDRRSS